MACGPHAVHNNAVGEPAGRSAKGAAARLMTLKLFAFLAIWETFETAWGF
jgi:hypothetical protein